MIDLFEGKKVKEVLLGRSGSLCKILRSQPYR